jgi:hypothetical protein
MDADISATVLETELGKVGVINQRRISWKPN